MLLTIAALVLLEDSANGAEWLFQSLGEDKPLI